MKTASEELKSKNGIPANANAVDTTISQPGPEDGRDQNITPDSNSYDPAKVVTKGNHNIEVHRTDENDTFKSADRK